MFLRHWLFIISLSLLLPSVGMAGNNSQNMIKILTNDIKKARNNKEKCCLLIYRARHFDKIKEPDKALKDYNEALELNHKGWIHLERSHFLMKLGKYEQAYKDADAAKDEVPTLAGEANAIMAAAITKIRKKYEAENPITIFMNGKVDPHRKTRFDLMREQGVFVAKARTSRKSVRKKTARKKPTTASCKPTKKRRG